MNRTTILFATLTLCWQANAQAPDKPVQAHYGIAANGAVLPDQIVTPGVVLTTDLSIICVPGYSKTVRHTSGKLKASVYAAYGIKKHKSGVWEIDHKIPIEAGGADVFENLSPQAYEPRPGAHEKDLIENAATRAACSGRVSIEAVQQCFAKDWTQCDKLY